MIGGTAAWGGVNLAIAIYGFFGCFGALGLLIGAIGIPSERIVFAWIADFGAVFIACIGVLFLGGFLFGRDKSVPLSDPIVALYCWAVLTCGIVIWLSSRRICKARAERNAAA